MKTEIVESKKLISTLILGSFALVNILYFSNLIPPIPLSLIDAGMYHSIEKTEDGNYTVTHEDSGRRGYFKLYPPFKETSGSPVYAYSAIFSPTDLNITIRHEWQYYKQEQDKWVTEAVISLPVVGGRDGGFRTYSAHSDLASGRWRVNIKTEQNKTIGHIRFKIVPVDTEPPLVSGVKR